MKTHWTRRRLLAFVLITVAILAPSLTSGADFREGKPDIVVVMVDDLGAIDERVLERLPNITDLFLDGGLRFDSAYGETPLCCPSRAAFLTGQHTRNHGVVRNSARLLDPSRTIATALHDAGYWTMFAGKYLNYPEKLSDHTPPGWDKVAMLKTWLGNVWSSWWVNDRGRTGGYHDRFLADKALQWLQNAPDNRPVFMWLTPRAPHWRQSDESGHIQGRLWPWQADVEKKYLRDDRCANLDPWKPANYAWSRRADGFPLGRVCRALLTVDDMVGDLRAEMAAQGRDPVWVFTSDNGMAWGADGYALKNVPAAAKLPLYVAGDKVATGSTNALVSNIDLAPTLADVGGVEMPWADGVSFETLLRGEPGGREWMLMDHPVGGYTGGKGSSGPWWGIRTPEWLMLEWNGTHLYDLATDPLAQVDVAPSHAHEIGELRSLATEEFPELTP